MDQFINGIDRVRLCIDILVRKKNASHFCSYCACASSYYAIGLMDRVDFTTSSCIPKRLSETFGSRFLGV